MSITVNWVTSDCRVIYWAFDKQWTWDDYFVSFNNVCRLAQSVEQRVDIIATLHVATMLPNGAVAAYKRTAQELPANVRSLAVVGANIWMRVMISGLRHIDSRLGDKIFFADNLHQALRLLCESCSTPISSRETARSQYPVASEIFR